MDLEQENEILRGNMANASTAMPEAGKKPVEAKKPEDQAKKSEQSEPGTVVHKKTDAKDSVPTRGPRHLVMPDENNESSNDPVLAEQHKQAQEMRARLDGAYKTAHDNMWRRLNAIR